MLAIGLLFALAVLAPVGLAHEASAEGLAAKLERASKAAERTAQRAEHLAERAAERATSKQKRAAERLARREARHKERESRRRANKAHKEKEGNGVAIDCTKVTVTYRGFPTVEGKPNYVVEWIAVKNPPESISKEPIVFPPLIYSFEGSTGTEVVHIPFPVGHYLIDVHAKWDTNGHKGNFDIHGNVTCMPEPAYTITKVQSLEGSAGAPTSEPLTGKVGQTVDYQITVTNTGNTPLTFTRFTDEHCESIEGGSLDPIEPLQTLSYFCSHKLTAADQTAGSYSNVASVTASTEPGEGGPLPPKKSNTVVVSPIAPETPKGEEKHEEKPGEKPGEKAGETPGQKTETPKTKTELAPGTGVIGTVAGKSGVLGFTSATVPSLKGPQGCVRGFFTASIRANGVNTVVFYLDGRRVSRQTYKNAHRGFLSVRINAAKLRVGVHHVRAQITMKQSSSSASAAHATRQLTVIRCASAVITPKFTG